MRAFLFSQVFMFPWHGNSQFHFVAPLSIITQNLIQTSVPIRGGAKKGKKVNLDFKLTFKLTSKLTFKLTSKLTFFLMLMLGFPAFPTQYFSKVGHFAFVTALFGGFPISATEDLS